MASFVQKIKVRKYINFKTLALCCYLCYFRKLHEDHKVFEIIDEESLKKCNITIEHSKADHNRILEKTTNVKNIIEEEIDKINKLYEKTFEEITTKI